MFVILYIKRKHIRWKKIVSYINNYFSSFIFNKPFNIYLSSFKGIKSNVKNKIVKEKRKLIFIDSLILKYSKSICTVKVNHQARYSGKSNYTLKKLFILWFDMIENFHFYPIRFGTLIGVLSYFFVKVIRFGREKRFHYQIKNFII